MNHDNCIYIDTTPGGRGLFSPSSTVNDYSAWLLDNYKECQLKENGKVAFYGVAQKMNSAINAARNGHPVRCLGQYASAAAAVLERIGGIEVEVLGTTSNTTEETSC
jgi:hypothetical protein